MVRRHIEGPQHFFYLEPLGISWRKKCGDTVPVTRFSAGPRHHHVIGRLMDASIPGLGAVYTPAITIPLRGCLHVGRIRAVVWLSNAERKASLAREQQWNPFFFLHVRAIRQH